MQGLLGAAIISSICFLATASVGYGLDESLTPAMVQGGAFAFIIWLGFYVVKSTIPDLSNTFKVESKEQRELFQSESQQNRDMFAAMVKEIQSGFISRLDEIFVAEIRQQRADFLAESSKERHAHTSIVNSLNLEKEHLMEKLAARESSEKGNR